MEGFEHTIYLPFYLFSGKISVPTIAQKQGKSKRFLNSMTDLSLQIFHIVLMQVMIYFYHKNEVAVSLYINTILHILLPL